MATFTADKTLRRGVVVLVVTLTLVVVLTVWLLETAPPPTEAASQFDRSAALAQDTGGATTPAAAALALAEQAHAAWSQHDLPKARALLRQAHALDPENNDLLPSLGELAYLAKDYPTARLYFEQYAARRPGEVASYTNLGITYLTLGKLDQADQAVKHGLTLPDVAAPGPLYMISAAVQLRRGNSAAAAEALAKAYPTLGHQFFVLADAQWARGLKDTPKYHELYLAAASQAASAAAVPASTTLESAPLP